jgi:(1->4)-alpha-D-glucan 1-alpha-D-glucosylmutase
VGGDPTRFGRNVAEFHDDNSLRRESWPLSLLATATHDTKRGEDARARINVLSEMPQAWRAAVGRWSRLMAPARRTLHDHPAPSPNEEYLLYQALLGAWPAGQRRRPGSDFVERMAAFMLKAIREAKVHTSWVNPAAEHETAVLEYVREALGGTLAPRFVRSFGAFASDVAFFGMLNSLAQLLLKLTSPGVPDIYGGTELWDFSLVDPDNRGPVDFALRQRLLAELPQLAQHTRSGETADSLRDLVAHWTDGRIKMYLTHAALELRRRHPSLFTDGSYVSLSAAGDKSDHVVAFGRLLRDEAVLVLVPRLVVGLTENRAVLPTGRDVWGDTALNISQGVPRGVYRNALTGEQLTVGDAPILVGDIITTLPVGLWFGPDGT